MVSVFIAFYCMIICHAPDGMQKKSACLLDIDALEWRGKQKSDEYDLHSPKKAVRGAQSVGLR